jgi:hypothetical protein
MQCCVPAFVLTIDPRGIQEGQNGLVGGGGGRRELEESKGEISNGSEGRGVFNGVSRNLNGGGRTFKPKNDSFTQIICTGANPALLTQSGGAPRRRSSALSLSPCLASKAMWTAVLPLS